MITKLLINSQIILLIAIHIKSHQLPFNSSWNLCALVYFRTHFLTQIKSLTTILNSSSLVVPICCRSWQPQLYTFILLYLSPSPSIHCLLIFDSLSHLENSGDSQHYSTKGLYGVRFSVSCPTPNLEDQGVSFGMVYMG